MGDAPGPRDEAEGAVEAIDEAPTAPSLLAASGDLTRLSSVACEGLKASGTSLFFTDSGPDLFGNGRGSVYRQTKSGTPGAETLLFDEPTTGDRFVSYGGISVAQPGGALSAYWAANETLFSSGASHYQIRRLSIADGVVTVLADRPGVLRAGPETDGSFLYWAEEGGLFRQPVGGGTVTQLVGLAPSQTAFALGLSPTHLYYATGGGVSRVPKAGGAVGAVLAGADVRNLHVVGSGTETQVYYTDANAAVKRKNVGSGATTTFFAGEAGRVARGVAFDGTRVLWLDEPAAGGPEFYRLQKVQGGVRTVLVTGTPRASALQFDAANAFWCDQGGVMRYTH
ncbi:MAG TPA: hypothetical protein VFS00_17035 [Polyangiaceae bacterium]|nr:hypothetical protein [Polyangiaceae bacterium]